METIGEKRQGHLVSAIVSLEHQSARIKEIVCDIFTLLRLPEPPKEPSGEGKPGATIPLIMDRAAGITLICIKLEDCYERLNQIRHALGEI